MNGSNLSDVFNQSIESTTVFDPTHLPTKRVVVWWNAFIIILGLFTNSLILALLGRKPKITSATTRIILMFMAVVDLITIVMELFVHFIPFYLQWFLVFHTDLGCGVALLVQATALTCSSWYILLMSMERAIVIYFPLKAKVFCTVRRIMVACLVIPVLCLIAFGYLLWDMGIDKSVEYYRCAPKESVLEKKFSFQSKLLLWMCLYFYIPAFLIVTLNSASVIKLVKTRKAQRHMVSVVRRESKEINGHSRSQKIFRALSRQSTSSSPEQKLKKATALVIAASVAFVVLMIPRGVSVAISLDAKWDYDNTTQYIFDQIAYLLQYLNHSINLFLYVLVNDNFRKELKTWFCRCKYTKKETRREIETDNWTQTSYVHHTKCHNGHRSAIAAEQVEPLHSPTDMTPFRNTQLSDTDLHSPTLSDESAVFLTKSDQ